MINDLSESSDEEKNVLLKQFENKIKNSECKYNKLKKS